MEVNLEKIIGQDDAVFRDAVHIAVIPMIADEDLQPGDHVGLTSYSQVHVGKTLRPIGIVSPFLNCVVKKGERFWMMMYPSTISTLRHHWDHPAFQRRSEASKS